MNNIGEQTRKVVDRVNGEIAKLKDKDFTMFFFTVDSKNVPSGSLVYTYELALSFKKLGYNVTILYENPSELTDREIRKRKEKGRFDPMDPQVFCGVGNWLGEEYGELKHLNIARENSWHVGPSDFLFIPEAFSSLMSQTYAHKIPCKRFVLLQNFDYVTDFIPFGTQWINFGISDCIATTNQQADLLRDVMPYVKTTVLNPCIPEYFRKPVKPKNLVVNVISKKQSDINKLMKTFYWKYPVYKFVSFKDLRGMARTHYADMLKEGAITVWIDTETPFGYGPVEAMRCGDIVIGKLPETVQDWMVDGNGNLCDNVVWFDNFKNLPDILADVIGSWMRDEIPNEITDAMEVTNGMYTREEWDGNVARLAEEIVSDRIAELESFKASINKESENNEGK